MLQNGVVCNTNNRIGAVFLTPASIHLLPELESTLLYSSPPFLLNLV